VCQNQQHHRTTWRKFLLIVFKCLDKTQ